MRKAKLPEKIGLGILGIIVIIGFIIIASKLSDISIEIIEISVYGEIFRIPDLKKGEFIGIVIYACIYIILIHVTHDPTKPMERKIQFECIQTKKALLKFIQKKSTQKRFWVGLSFLLIVMFFAYYYELTKSLETYFVKTIVYSHIALLLIVYAWEGKRGDLNGIEKNHKISFGEYFSFFLKKFSGSIFGMMTAFSIISGEFIFSLIIGLGTLITLGIPYSALASYTRKKHYS